ncbi:TPA_asm: protein 5 [Cupressus virus 1]|uniref:Protein 5 n=1 Tax=Cupressus virus 1 TaxID=2977965 RepID=A0A9N7AB39_9RHAB|nr:TPA_asm: protein 5 [Cupressus virus 1]
MGQRMPVGRRWDDDWDIVCKIIVKAAELRRRNLYRCSNALIQLDYFDLIKYIDEITVHEINYCRICHIRSVTSDCPNLHSHQLSGTSADKCVTTSPNGGRYRHCGRFVTGSVCEDLLIRYSKHWLITEEEHLGEAHPKDDSFRICSSCLGFSLINPDIWGMYRQEGWE